MWQTLLMFFSILGLSSTKYFIIGSTRLTLLKIVDCQEFPNTLLKSVFLPHDYNKTYQLVDVKFHLPVPLDETVGISMKSLKEDKNKKQQHAFLLEDPNACEVMNKYVGDLWFDLQSKSGMEPGVCPIKAGNYSVENIHLDLGKMKVQMFLEGTFHTRVSFKQNNKVILCKDIRVKLEPDN